MKTTLILALLLLLPASLCAVTYDTSTIKSSGGDYTSLSNWEAGEDDTGDLVTNEEIDVAECYASAAPDNTGFSVQGWTTSVDYYIRIYTPISERHSGKWDETAYRMEISNSAGIYMSEEYVDIDGLQIKILEGNANGQAPISASVAAGGSRFNVSNCILITHTNDTVWTYCLGMTDADIGELNCWNTIFYHRAGANASDSCLYNYASTTTISNCTIIGGRYGLRTVKTTATRQYFRNVCISSTSTADFTYSTGPNYDISYCVSEDESADDKDGEGNKVNQDFSGVYVDIPTTDLHLTSDSTILSNCGISMDGNEYLSFTTDIDGETRSGTWDIGVDEYVSGEPPPEPSGEAVPIILILE